MRGLWCLLLVAACSAGDETPKPKAADPLTAARLAMVDTQIATREVVDERVLAAMRKVLRHEFVPSKSRKLAYSDTALRIGHKQTISQPYIVAIMTQLAGLTRDSKVLEIGTGSGYGAAVLAEVAKEVYTIEILPELAESSSALLKKLGYDNVSVRHADGYQGWEEAGPFDAIVVTAAPPHVPEPLKQQLKIGGRLVLPVGDRYQEMLVIERTKDGFSEQAVFPVRFVPMTGEAQDANGD